MHTFRTHASSSLILFWTKTSGQRPKRSCENSLLGTLVLLRALTFHQTFCKALWINIHPVVSMFPPPMLPLVQLLLAWEVVKLKILSVMSMFSHRMPLLLPQQMEQRLRTTLTRCYFCSNWAQRFSHPSSPRLLLLSPGLTSLARLKLNSIIICSSYFWLPVMWIFAPQDVCKFLYSQAHLSDEEYSSSAYVSACYPDG